MKVQKDQSQLLLDHPVKWDLEDLPAQAACLAHKDTVDHQVHLVILDLLVKMDHKVKLDPPAKMVKTDQLDHMVNPVNLANPVHKVPEVSQEPQVSPVARDIEV